MIWLYKIINTHKHILRLDPALEKVISADSLFVSHRSAKTIADLLISSKRPQQSAVIEPLAEHHDSLNPELVDRSNENLRCKKCSASRCYMCKNFLIECDTFSIVWSYLASVRELLSGKGLNVKKCSLGSQESLYQSHHQSHSKKMC
jgi:hypothetical protein